VSLPIALRQAAKAELDAAVDWYEGQAGNGFLFLARTQATFDLIASQPYLFQITFQDVCRAD
jgi:hypothetical protein